MRALLRVLRRRWPFVVAGVLVLGAIAGALAYNAWREPGDVTNENAEFQDTGEAAPPEQPPRKRKAETFVWPQFGYTRARTRYLPTKLGPRLRNLWKYRANELLEFPPILVRGVLYLVRNDGVAVALRAKTGKRIWQRRVGKLNASSPAYAKGRLYIATLTGTFTALNARNGKVRWRKSIGSRSESSPLAIGARVYFGSESGKVFALRARDGKTMWTYDSGGPVKSALAFSQGKLFFGDYGGSVTALSLKGDVVWKTGTQGRSFGRVGRVYSTPAVKFGRVYVGSLDGRVYSFVARTGELAWSHSTGGYVYASPAVARAPGTRPSVYIGSYDGNFYALDARNGREIWKHDAGGRISGSATVVGRTVYFANLGARNTRGLDVRNGRVVFRFPGGGFTPVISDGRRLYLTGWSRQYALVPRKARRARKKE